MKKNKDMKFFGLVKIYPFIKNNIKYMVMMAVCGVLSQLASVFLPLFQKYAIDNFIAKTTFDGLYLFIICYFVLVVFSGIVTFMSTNNSFKGEMYIKRDLRNRAYSHLGDLSFSYFSKNNVGYIHSRLMSDVTSIAFLLSMHLPYLLTNIAYVLGSIIVMLVINYKFALIVMALVPIIALLLTVFQAKLISSSREIRKRNSKLTSNFNEEITGIKTIKTLGVEKSMISSFLSDSLMMKRKSVNYARIGGLFSGIMSFIVSLIIAILLMLGGSIEESEIGTFAMFMTYAQSMVEPFRYLAFNISKLFTCRANIERYTNLVNEKSDVEDKPEVIEKYGDLYHPKKENWEKVKGDIEFSHVTFHYPDGEENVLEDFSMKIKAGSMVAIVGETGAGKSTLVNLIGGFYRPNEGQILIDGKDIRERSKLWLNSSVGYVLQTPHLFSGTIRENLKYGKEDATEEEMLSALELVNAKDIVTKLEKGLDSEVGEGGDLLSSGEKQLISFARAVISQPKILILDEATAWVDTITEQKIQQAMDSVIKDRTSIVIAHRLSTIRNADIILVVKDGKIVEQGSHDELMEKKGYYNLLKRRQYEMEETEEILNGAI